ncbi:MAG: MGH1-like glycoside hydrolase domain-containing protein [Acidimicrobiales bacterium]
MSASLKDRCSQLLRDHRVEAFGGTFHVPDRERYPALFAWDSGYHALSMLHLEPDAALDELQTLYRANRLPDGLLSHQRFVPGAEEHQRFIEDLFGPMFDGHRTPFVDPPTAAYAAARLSLALGAPGDQLLDDAVAHLRGLARHRTVDGRSLPVVLHPFETGTEGSALMRSLLPGGLGASLARFKELTISCRSAGMAPEAALAANHGFVVYDPTVCGWYLLALEEVAAACRARGRETEAEETDATAGLVARDLVALLWWDEGEIFVAYDLTRSQQLHGIGAMGLVPAASRALAESGLSQRVAERHLRPDGPMWGPHGFAAGTIHPRRGVGTYVQWDGNAVWGATVYWAYLVAARLGWWAEASRLRDQLTDLIDVHGFREFYDALTGEPGGAGAGSGFTWPALALDMTIPPD